MREIIITAALMTASYIMYIFGIVYGVPAENMMIGALCLMGVSFSAGSTFAEEQCKTMLSDILDDIARSRK